MKELSIIKKENIAQIVQAAPQSYEDNAMSHDKCVDAGNRILSLIEQNNGQMNDELDQQASVFIEKARKTVRKMNERRAPVTKLFDEVRTAFTSIENDIDPSKANTIGHKLQQYRNGYAAQKREEEARRLREEQQRQQAKQERERYRIDVSDDLRYQFDDYLNNNIKMLHSVDESITLDNFEQMSDVIRKFSAELPQSWIDDLHAKVKMPMSITLPEAKSIEAEVKQSLVNTFAGKYMSEIENVKMLIIDKLPSKRSNLERIAQSDKEEAERIKAMMQQKEKEEAARLEQERLAREQKEKKEAESKRQAVEMGGLFAQASVMGEQSKVKVTAKIKLLNPEGILPIITMWWSKEGCNLTVEELMKMFKKQITYCEKLANKEDLLIKDESIEYVEEVKAK